MTLDPNRPQLFDEFDQALQLCGFHEVGRATERFGAIPVRIFAGAAEHELRHGFQAGLGAHPGQQAQAVDARHFDIGDDQAGQGVAFGVGPRQGMGQILNGVPAVMQGNDAMPEVAFVQGIFHEEQVVL